MLAKVCLATARGRATDQHALRRLAKIAPNAITLFGGPPAGFPERLADNIAEHQAGSVQGGFVCFEQHAIESNQANELKLRVEDAVEPRRSMCP